MMALLLQALVLTPTLALVSAQAQLATQVAVCSVVTRRRVGLDQEEVRLMRVFVVS